MFKFKDDYENGKNGERPMTDGVVGSATEDERKEEGHSRYDR